MQDADLLFAHVTGIAAVFLLAGCVKGITGMGLPTVAMSLLGLWLPPAQAAAMLVLPSLATNVAQCRGPHTAALARRLWPAWLMLVMATLLVPAPTSRAVDGHAALGTVLVAYGLWGLWRPALPDLQRHARWLGALAGLATGAVTACTAVFVLPLVPWLQTLRLDKDAMVQALGLSFTIATLALALRLQHAGGLQLLLPEGALALSAAFAGLALGNAVRARLSGAAFQRGLFGVFVGLGAANLLRAS